MEEDGELKRSGEERKMDWFEKAKKMLEDAVQAVRRFDFTVWVGRVSKTNWVSVGHRVRDWVKANRNNVLIGAGVILAAVIFLGWSLRDRAAKNDEARGYFSQALNSYNRAVQARDITPEDRQNELGRAMQVLQEMQRRFPSSAMTADGVFYLGNILYSAGQHLQAVEQFEEYIRKYPRTYLAPYAAENIGYCYEQSGDLPAAIEAFDRVRKRWPKSSLAGRAGLNIARCHEAQGDFKSAFEHYQTVQAEAPNSVWARQAYLRMTYLEARFQHGSAR